MRTSRMACGAPLALGLATAGLLVACGSPRRAPGPMPFPEIEAGEETGPAAPFASGAEVSVVRHSDTVSVQRPGSPGVSPLTFYRKKTRLGIGSRVFTSDGARVELLWPGDASTVIMMGSGGLVLGDTNRDEPFVRFLDVSRARLYLTPEDRVELPGGAILRGDPVYPSGPFSLELVNPRILRVRNQSMRGARIDYRTAALPLGAGDEIDLPLLSSGTAPLDPDPSATSVETGIVDFVFTGRVEWAVVDGRVRITAQDESEIEALGLRVRLAPGQEVLLAPPEAYSPPRRVMGKRDPAEQGGDGPEAPAPDDSPPRD